MYYYRTYGLLLGSAIEFPELLPALPNGLQPDVQVRIGPVPPMLQNPAGRGVLYQASPNEFLLELDKVARYLVQNGDEIIVEPAPQSLPSDVRIFLLASCLAALLHQRGILALHASAIRSQQGAVLFCGPSGIGKSTLLGAFLGRGYQMVADDISGIILDDAGSPIVLPAFPRTKFWADAANRLGFDPATMVRTRPGLEKYSLSTEQQFSDEPLPIWRIYRLSDHNQDTFLLDELPPIENFQVVLANTYRQQFLDGLAMRASHFQLVSAVAATTAIRRVVRPSAGYRLAELIHLLEEDFQGAPQANPRLVSAR